MTHPVPRKRYGDGLQAERTSLAWTRTSFAVLVNGVLLLVRDDTPDPGRPLWFLPACVAGLGAALVYGVGRFRQRALGRRPLPGCVEPRWCVPLAAGVVLVLLLVTAGASLVPEL